MASIPIQLLAMIISLFLFWLFFMIFFRKKDKKKKVQWVPMCPKCGSVDVTGTFLNSDRKISMRTFAPSRYVCNKCKYEGMFPEVQVDMLETIRKELKSSKTKEKAPAQKTPKN